MYPKRSALGCLKKLSLASGVFHVISSVVAGISCLATLGLLAMTIVSGNFLDGMMSQVFTFADSSGGFMDLFMLVSDMLVGILVGLVVCFVLFFALNVRRACTHLGRNRMLGLYPSDSGLRVYRYQLAWTILGLLWSILLLVFGVLIQSNSFEPVSLAVSFVPFVSMVLDLVTWIYMSSKFNRLMEEMNS